MDDRLTPEQARQALTTAAWTVDDPESADHGRTLVHCLLGGIGADWDLDAALALVDGARDIRWVPHLLAHDLAVIAEDGRLHRFDVKRPAHQTAD
jgi:hypothetical protein